MHYVVSARFRPDVDLTDGRLQARFNAHLEQLVLRIKLEGSLVDKAGSVAGVFLLIEAERLDQVEDFVGSSPYVQDGLYDRVDIHRLDLHAGAIG
jgi:uncharacterized protein YciI